MMKSISYSNAIRGVRTPALSSPEFWSGSRHEFNKPVQNYGAYHSPNVSLMALVSFYRAYIHGFTKTGDFTTMVLVFVFQSSHYPTGWVPSSPSHHMSAFSPENHSWELRLYRHCRRLLLILSADFDATTSLCEYCLVIIHGTPNSQWIICGFNAQTRVRNTNGPLVWVLLLVLKQNLYHTSENSLISIKQQSFRMHLFQVKIHELLGIHTPSVWQ